MYEVINWRKTKEKDFMGYVIQEGLIRLDGVVLGWFRYNWQTSSLIIDGQHVYDWKSVVLKE